MGRQPSTGQTTCTIRLPKRFKQEVQDYLQFLKLQEKKFTREKISETLATVQQAGLIELHSIAQTYGITPTDRWGQCLPKEELRQRLIEFLGSKIKL